MILEGLVSTLDANGTVRVSAMGPTVRGDFAGFLFRPFPTANTFLRLKATREGVFHVTDDAALMAKAAVGKLSDTPLTVPAAVVAGAVLADCCRAYEFRVTGIDESGLRVHVETEVVKVHRVRDFFGFNRAKHAVLEAAILATRFHLLPAAEVDAEYKKLRQAVDKTGGPAEIEAMAMLEAEWAAFRSRP